MTKKLKIAQLVPPFLPVPPKKYGGTELIASYLTEELVKKGHQVTLFASGDSKTKARLVSAFPKSLYKKGTAWHDSYSSLLQTISCAEELENFDIVHNHFYYWGMALDFLTKAKTVTTYHGDFNSITQNSPRYELLKKFKKQNFISISNSQRRVKDLKLNFVKTIYNGIDVNNFEFSEKKGKYLVWMGRITPKKGLLEAIEIAQKVNIPLKIAAKIDKNHLSDVKFYEEKVKPKIDNKNIIYIGEIGGYQAKSRFLKNSLALLNPIKWEEPFGLVMAEAMACGTPVIAFNRGSVEEVLEDKKTGFIVKNVNQAIIAVKKIEQINRFHCRERVEKNFSKEKMVEEYEKVYYKLLK